MEITKFKTGDRVIVIRNIPKTAFERDNSFGTRTDYPIIGLTGILERRFSFDSNQWVINWDISHEEAGGDLIYEWMMKKIEGRKTMKKGDKVIVIDRGAYYGSYGAMAIAMKATNWRREVRVYSSEIGIIKCIKPHLSSPKTEGKLALVEFEGKNDEPGKQIIIGIRGLQKYNPNNFYPGDTVIITKKVEKQKNWRDKWRPFMDEYIGRIGIISSNDGVYGIAVKVRGGNTYRYPSTALKKIPKEEMY